MLADDRLGIFERPQQRGDGGWIAQVSRHHRRIAQQSGPLGPGQRRAAKTGPESVCIQIQYLGQVQRFSSASFRSKLRVYSASARAVPGAHFLTDITAKQPVTDFRPQLGRNRPPVLNGEVGDAAVCIQPLWTEQRIGRASVDTRRAGAAVFAQDWIGPQ